MENITIFTDGGARGNPGPAAIGFVIKDASGKNIKGYGEIIGETTNNEAEYCAVISALSKARALFGKEKTKHMSVDVRMDSEFVVRQLNGKYKIEEERFFPLFIKIWNLKMDFRKISFAHVPREKNREADRLVNEALDRENSQGRLLNSYRK